jgi:peptide/nickel transport system substrate-binding protein
MTFEVSAFDGASPEERRRLTRRELMHGAAGIGVAGAALGLLAACDTGGDDAPVDRASEETPRRGGRLRVGIVGGGGAEGFDPGLAASTASAIIMGQVFDRFVHVPKSLEAEPAIIEEFEPNADATEWTIRVRDGVVWHDGKPLTVDDVLYTLRRISGPDQAGASLVEPIRVNEIKKLDGRTLRLPLKRPFAQLPDNFTTSPTSVVQDGADDFAKPVGTGPFMLESFTPGQRVLYKRNPDYWREGQPYVDELELVSIPDAAARLNALLGGEVDAIEGLTYAQAVEHREQGRIRVLEAQSSATIPITMSVEQEPFRDPRLREAFRLIADREALVEGALLGFGEIGNDIFCKGFKYYHEELPQREADPEKARALLREAGAENLEITLYSSTLQAGMLESATIFAEQARELGVSLKVDNGPADSYFTDRYLKVAFGQSLWGPVPLSYWYPQAVTSNAPFNETHWKRPEFDEIVRTASGELDDDAARMHWYDAQEILWNEGGYLLWGFIPWLDGVGTNVGGVEPNGFLSLDNATFRKYWLNA